ncbi:hypothetical protein AbraIFM66951_001999 [Aspergillus brasiliensis]|uniref:GST C-terminal domain-containing protein n=1 Tax=Aspergillus brasiliensis TaxID=319629 RepID=A0A9W5YYD9_9EURO|nr:hypothetical protein AbraCBS73388_011781 [Aspergillus brasiliensis]GKZ49435.1 hypothetical protein AbraIFM66951_001999 [Aspergillus brasiliensis]
MTDQNQTHGFADSDGHFRRKPSAFRSHISSDPTSDFPAQKDRYVLYLSWGCPWAHRTNIVRTLKALENIIELVVLDPDLGPDGWFFSGRLGTAERDPRYGFTLLRELYRKADPEYTGRCTVPVLWDTQRETIVNNESSEIIQMMYTEFDHLLLPAHVRELELNHHPGGGGGFFYPVHPRAEIDAFNEWVYHKISNGVYKTGFATTQAAYEENVYPLFQALDLVEARLRQQEPLPYLFGDHITDADIRLYTTICRFDVAYYGIFRCNLKMIRHDYPLIDRWYRRLYHDDTERTRGAFKKTTFFDIAPKPPTSPTQPQHTPNPDSIRAKFHGFALPVKVLTDFGLEDPAEKSSWSLPRIVHVRIRPIARVSDLLICLVGDLEFRVQEELVDIV